MKNILVPIDFSDCSLHALDTAQLFAKKTKARLHVMHVLEPILGLQASHFQEAELLTARQLALQSAHAKLNELMSTTSHTNYEVIVVEQQLITAISDYCEAQQIDLIIMGSFGLSGVKEYLIGSNTQKVIRKIHATTLVVKKAMTELELNSVIFASDFDTREIEALLKFKAFIMPFAPKVHLVHINEDPFFGSPYVVIKEAMKQAALRFAPLEVETHIFRELTVDKGIRALSEQLDADLIGISNHVKRPLKRIFSGSNVEALVNHAEAPVLSIDF